MDERQAEAIAKSLLEPELKAREVRQEELLERQRRVAFNSSPLAVRQRSVSFALFGIAAGMAVGYFGVVYVARGVIIWGIAICLVAGFAVRMLSNRTSRRRDSSYGLVDSKSATR
jgi:Flp pilus assembly protein TadB